MKWPSRKKFLGCGILLIALFALGMISGIIPLFSFGISYQAKVNRLKSPEKFEAIFEAGVRLMREKVSQENFSVTYYESYREGETFEEYVKKHPEFEEIKNTLGKDADILSVFILEQRKGDPDANRLLIRWGGGFIDLQYTIYGNPFGKITADIMEDGETLNSLSHDYSSQGQT